MLKRYQVLINDWLADYVKYFSEKYDLSFSEVIRIMLCLQTGQWVSLVYPNFKFKISLKKIKSQLKKLDKQQTLEEEEHKLISKLYFEARKATDLYLSRKNKLK